MALKVTKTQWLDAGMVRFGTSGLDGLKVEAMARELGSSKAGFYWYFKSRPAFERALFDHWRTEETRQIIAAAERARTPAQKIALLFAQVIHLRRGKDFLFHLRRLAQSRPRLARLLEEIEAERIGYLAVVLQELGKNPAEARQAAETVYHLYLGWYERHRFRPTTRVEANKQLCAVSALIGVEIAGATRSRR
jgi:AcrR family transcriptional regulator